MGCGWMISGSAKATASCTDWRHSPNPDAWPRSALSGRRSDRRPPGTCIVPPRKHAGRASKAAPEAPLTVLAPEEGQRKETFRDECKSEIFIAESQHEGAAKADCGIGRNLGIRQRRARAASDHPDLGGIWPVRHPADRYRRADRAAGRDMVALNRN